MKTAWYETFFGGIYNEILGHGFHADAATREARIVRRALHLRKGERVLDVPCGMGRLTLPLAKMGLAMTGVDLTRLYILRARRRARAEGLDIRFVECDMREIEFEEEFEGAFNWFGSFGYFTEPGNAAFARRVFRALKPGGRFLVEGLNKTWLLAHFGRRREEVVGGVRVRHDARFDGRTGRVHDTWEMTKGRRVERHVISIKIYDGGEIRGLLRAAGFREIELYGRRRLWSRPGPFTRHSRRFIAVATKPE